VFPEAADLSWPLLSKSIADHLRFKRPRQGRSLILQRAAPRLLPIILILLPLMIWTGLAMSPAFTSAFPAPPFLLGGQHSARTIHFCTLFLLLLLIANIVMARLAEFPELHTSQAYGPHEQQIRSNP
jgi:thiosulfate reductase cytochrome b subunit